MIAFTLSLVVTAITALSPLPAEPYIPAPTPIEATSDFSSFRYTVEASASIRWSAQRVDLVERITLENVGELPIASVNLLSFPRGVDAWSNERLFVDGVEQVATHPTKISIGILFPEPVASGASVTIELLGTISPARSRDRFGRLGWSGGTLNLGQWLALPDRPVRRSTVGDPVSPPPADSIEIRVTSDRTLGRDAVQASGLLLDGPDLRGRSWRFRIENARGAALLANPELRVVRRIEPTSGVRIVGAARSRSDASSLSWDARLALGPFSRWFGTPPWELLRVVELPGLAIAQEYPGLITIGERVRSQRFVVWHETAHQWWYGLVANDQRDEPWVDESLSQFAAALRSGASSVGSCSSRPIDLPSERYGAFYGCRGYYESVYQRGAALLFAIRRSIGESRLLGCLRDFVAARRFARPDGDDLAASLLACDPRVAPILRRYLSELP